MNLSSISTTVDQSKVILPSLNNSELCNPSSKIRTAVNLTGQLRTANITFQSGKMLKTREYYWFGSTDAPTPAGTIIEMLFKQICKQGPFDVYMHLLADPKYNETWNGEPWTFRETIGDLSGCRVFSDHAIFHNTGNKFFCYVEPEEQLISSLFDKNSFWEKYFYVARYKDFKKKEQYIHQIYSMYKGNLGCKQFSIASNIVYTHKIRVRPDSGFLDFFPPYEFLDFGPHVEKGCNSTIFFSNTAMINAIGGQDLFAVGLAKDMDNYLDLYLDFISKPPPKFILQSSIWMAEEFMLNNLLEKYAICLDMNVRIKLTPIRADKDWRKNKVDWEKKDDWVELSS